ncbi:hypothetical protein JRO89_XS06G0022100 [Xanthoceras sorbifolium]|uniref:starch synthase n=1 Tax=Xanthoceras sorbifolium TaxID=99658 RepID=A0ABQ8HW69_9ROSI|nr:hypothetical protein JRO89_XS06G0022100 [Xanthoceras sorbifolium]
MASKLSTCFLSPFLVSQNSSNNNSTDHFNVRFLFSSRRFLPASCKMRHRSFSSQYKRQRVKKGSPEQPPTNAAFVSSGDEDTEPGDASTDSESSLNEEIVDVAENNSVAVEHIDEQDLGSTIVPDLNKSLALDREGEEQLSGDQLDNLISMIRNAEKNIHLLNEARVQALEDLHKILGEKEALQGEINVLEMRLAETDARIKVATQEKIHVELLEDQLQKLRNELSQRGAFENSKLDTNENQKKLLNEEPVPDNSSIISLSKELDSLRTENLSLNNDVQALKTQLNNIKNTDERVVMLEKERTFLESSLKELESKLSISQEDVSKLSTLKVECKDLYEKVENLQGLLDKSTKQADQAILVLQQNQELRKKVDKLEESLDEANVYKLSSEKMHQYNELMQQKIKLLEERLQRSDEEIHSYVQLYQESVKEFQDTLNSLKEESKKRALDEPVDDMPWEFWSRLLLIIEGWLLEKKISTSEAKLFREMVWKRDRHIHDAYMACKKKNEREAVSTFLSLTSSSMSSGLHVIHIAAEMAPVAKVGGLGDVITGIGKALQKRGHLVEIILPKYDCMQYDRVQELRVLDVVVESYFDGRLFKNKVWVGTVEGLPVYFIEPHHPDKFFWRGEFYGERDDFKRFSFFSRAALELLLQAGKKPDIIHCHDWQTAFVAPLYWDLYAPKGLNSARICFTCHNFEYQGTAHASELASCGLDVQQLNRPDRMQDNSAHDRINPVKGAIVFSNIVTTVSPSYAQEVRTAEIICQCDGTLNRRSSRVREKEEESATKPGSEARDGGRGAHWCGWARRRRIGGKGLHSTLNFHSKKFVGILNGIDTDTWNPATDTFLKVQYNANDLQGKAENKVALRRHLALSFADARQPLIVLILGLSRISDAKLQILGDYNVGCITRLVPQKGVHLIRHAIYRTLELGGQFVLLGSSPVPHIQREFEGIANHFQNHDHIRLILKYDESLSHSIYAASDMFIIPSIFEPCGLTQMIAMRYGSIPITRKTGGLNDSVFDFDDDTIPLQFRNGYTFLNPDEQGLNSALDRAFNHYKNNPESWHQLVYKDMTMDWSWDSSALQYEELYAKSVARARATTIRA